MGVSRAERRERKRNAEKRRIRKHGKTLGEVYRNAVEKRLPTHEYDPLCEHCVLENSS